MSWRRQAKANRNTIPDVISDEIFGRNSSRRSAQQERQANAVLEVMRRVSQKTGKERLRGTLAQSEREREMRDGWMGMQASL